MLSGNNVAPSATVAGTSSTGTDNVNGNLHSRPSGHKFSLHEFSTYVASEARIVMLPRFSLPAITLMGGIVGPFAPNYPVTVPLWLALYFRQTGTCKLRPPAFLSKEFLETTLQQERSNDATFEALHFHFFEVAKLFFEHAQEDLGSDCNDIMRLVPEILARRREKMSASIAGFSNPVQTLHVPALKVTNLVSIELHALRTSFCNVLDLVAELDRRGAANIGAAAELGGGDVSAGRASENITPHRSTVGSTTIAATEASSAVRSEGGASSVHGGDITERSIDGEVDGQTQASDGPALPVLKKRRTLRQR